MVAVSVSSDDLGPDSRRSPFGVEIRVSIALGSSAALDQQTQTG
jgi:hypothetical protein